MDQIKGDLVRRISHELKPPLISIYSGTQYLLNQYKHEMSNDILKFVNDINKGGYRLKEFVDNLLIAYEIESGEFKLKIQREDLIPIIKDCIEGLITLASKREVFLNVELLDEIYLDIDKIKIGKAISNLLSNAIKYTPPRGNVFLQIIDHQHYVDLKFKDTGIGLTEEEIPKLFKRFGKIERYGKSMDVDIEGPGLGLYISKEIIRLHGGEILVGSKGRNKGSRFIIRIYKN